MNPDSIPTYRSNDGTTRKVPAGALLTLRVMEQSNRPSWSTDDLMTKRGLVRSAVRRHMLILAAAKRVKPERDWHTMRYTLLGPDGNPTRSGSLHVPTALHKLHKYLKAKIKLNGGSYTTTYARIAKETGLRLNAVRWQLAKLKALRLVDFDHKKNFTTFFPFGQKPADSREPHPSTLKGELLAYFSEGGDNCSKTEADIAEDIRRSQSGVHKAIAELRREGLLRAGKPYAVSAKRGRGTGSISPATRSVMVEYFAMRVELGSYPALDTKTGDKLARAGYPAEYESVAKGSSDHTNLIKRACEAARRYLTKYGNKPLSLTGT